MKCVTKESDLVISGIGGDMEDRYLYKAKSIYSEEWVQGYYAFINNHHYIYSGSLCNGGLYVVPEKFEINIDTLCACTGLKDNDNNLTWENDIVKCKYGTAIVEWDRVEWKIRWIEESIWRRDLRHWSIDDAEGIEVIGNIFDNPELLESEE